ncbi:MAG: hypothetical protein FH748_13845 [Balneolaceae bacterium]|nr:hypothetical protein [Balneolaceae bacterium]
MSEQIWEKADNLKPDLTPPDKIIEELSSGLIDATDGLVNFEIEKVNFFPEEVTYSVEIKDPFLTSAMSQFGGSKKTKNPHPEFGYDTSEGKNIAFRYRYILKVVEKPSVKAEIFKFKYPVDFYPVRFFIEKNNFNTLKEFIDEEDDNLQVENEESFRKVCLAIFQSEEFARIVRRLSAIGT